MDAFFALDRGLYLTRQMGMTALIEPLMRAWHFVLEPKEKRPSKSELAALQRRYLEVLRRDLENVEQGYYPRDLLFDLSLRKYLGFVPNGVVEFPRIMLRRMRKRFRDLPKIEHADEYPDYYLRTFHWQTDGWFSDRSARLYDFSVEALFLGTADIMRRMTFPPLVRALRGKPQPRILDVACGTGRYLSQLHRALPDAKLYGLDLSPNYLELAKEVLGKIGGVSLVKENAEAMPFKDQMFDAVTCVFLFHELPGEARRNVLREIYRVLEPGGVFVIDDAAQLDDGQEINKFLEAFPKLYHEPYFKSYVRDDLPQLLEEAGFEVQRTESHFVSKMVVALKPHSVRPTKE